MTAMRLIQVIAGTVLVTFVGACGGVGSRSDGAPPPEAGRETSSADRPACDPDAPYIARMKARISGYRDYAYSRGDHSHANDQIAIGDVEFFMTDNMMVPPEPGSPMEARLWGANGELLSEYDMGDPLWREYGEEGLRQDDVYLDVQLYPGAAYFQVFERVAQKEIVLFDLRPHIQRLCVEQPCLKLCQPAVVDGGADGNSDAVD
jgi:hypothetical protein